MLLTAVDHVIDRPNFSAELKLDGRRGMVYGDDRVILSRQQKTLTDRFAGLAGVIKHFQDRHAIVDGEIVAFVDGLPNFAALQGRRTPTVFVAFDVLSLDGAETMTLPLVRRRELLAELVGPDSDRLLRSRAFSSATALLAEAEARGLEGIVTKDDASPYVPAPRRTRYWLKTKTSHGRREDRIRQNTWGTRTAKVGTRHTREAIRHTMKVPTRLDVRTLRRAIIIAMAGASAWVFLTAAEYWTRYFHGYVIFEALKQESIVIAVAAIAWIVADRLGSQA